ncbi:CDP-diacylglycerol--glycerol-3-phosphate 3-phosphatidyltransferase [Sulfobacillus thermosulfidooxidans]|uniref:CDP-diacylglycerol--glycerol-3-phosphate 3-phosphatidyltransferase n=1 Tax=Sulfobacillus thermosulfidooxidans TaxID=28034 RepID=UPI0006B49681|nr:CDP-diacylglycerol--glycerol-3-phosphate 3-phosphatidyltransferase [Sulfobacillus thermosulfidooxidans]
MNVADYVTLSRVVLTPVVIACWLEPSAQWHWFGLAIFIVAGLTDFIDGRLARHLTHTTRVGSYLDPLADKILVLGAGLALIATGRLSAWLLFIVLLRELAITGLRSVLPPGTTMAASYPAKWKTTSQLFALGASAVLGGWVADGFWAVAIILTIWTGWEYFYHYWPKN